MKDKTTAAILAFFIGGIGIHRFYLGQAGLGIVYMLFCWTLIPSFVAFIDFIAFLAMSRQSFDLKYNNRYSPQQPQNNVQSTTVVNNVYASPTPQAGQHASNPNTDHKHNLDALERLFDLRQKGVLSQEEFEREKAKVLGHQGSPGAQNSKNSSDPFLRN
jgi:TM2 domain-containing membrane protein YozV